MRNAEENERVRDEMERYSRRGKRPTALDLQSYERSRLVSRVNWSFLELDEVSCLKYHWR